LRDLCEEFEFSTALLKAFLTPLLSQGLKIKPGQQNSLVHRRYL
jgi:hypothetical protein